MSGFSRVRQPANLLALIVAISFVALAAVYSLITPAFEAPDEIGHFVYAWQLRVTGRLPVQHIGELGQAHQPPLYYLAAAIAMLPADLSFPPDSFPLNPHRHRDVNVIIHRTVETFPFSGQALALHLARAVSILMGLVTVVLSMAIVRKMLPGRLSLQLLTGALIAFNPQFLFISGSVSPDNLLVMAGAGIGWQLLRTLERPQQRRQWIYLGGWIAFAGLAKFDGLYLGAIAGAILILVMLRRQAVGLLIRGGLLTVLVVTGITSWWFIRNQTLYGDPFGWTMYQTVGFNDVRPSPLGLDNPARFIMEQQRAFGKYFRSFWGWFGWLKVQPPRWFYTAMRALVLLALTGLILAIGRFRKWPRVQRLFLAGSAIVVVAQVLFLIYVISICAYGCEQGRYLFPVITPLAILLSVGLVAWLPNRAVPFASAAVSIGMAAVALWMPFNVIAPAYDTAVLPKTSLWFIPNKMDLTFGPIQLEGYAVQSDGAQAKLTLYWRALQRPPMNYSAFVHLIDSSGQMVAQADHAPGEKAGYPPTAWWPGDIIADDHIVALPTQLSLNPYHFRVGLYNWVTGDRVPVTSNGNPLGDFVELNQLLPQ